jgi:hypothetical protein
MATPKIREQSSEKPQADNTRSTQSFALPDSIPERWLTQIRTGMKADRPSMLWALLGSSVLGAVIAAGTSIGTAYFTIKASYNLEVEKSRLEQERLTNKIAFESARKLTANLNDVLQSFDAFAAYLDIAQKENKLKDLEVQANLDRQAKQIGAKVYELGGMKSDPSLNQVPWESIDMTTGPIILAVQTAKKDPASFGNSKKSLHDALQRTIASLHLTIQ